MSDLDQLNPEMGATEELGAGIPDSSAGGDAHMGGEEHHHLEVSPEEKEQQGKMAKADLYKLASYSHKLFKQLHDDDELENWVEAKITKAADYIATVYHYLEYEMKVNEFGKHLNDAEITNEQRAQLQNMLSEAKMKIKELKLTQAEKVTKKLHESHGLERPCAECGGTGKVAYALPEETKEKVAKYNRLVKATKAAHKRLDANHNGIPDDMEGGEVDENFDGERGGDQETPSKFNKQKTGPNSTRYTRKSSTFSDEHDGGDGQKSHAKAKSSDEKKADKSNDIKLPKHDKPTWGMKGGEKFGKKDESVAEAKKAKPDFLDMDKDGDKKEPMKKAVADKKKNPFGKKVDEAKKEKAPEGSVSSKRFETDAQRVSRLAKEKKQAEKKTESIVSKAKSMWNNIKETESYIAEKSKKAKPDFLDMDKDGNKSEPMKKAVADKKKETVNESSEVSRMRELAGRLNRNENIINESREADTFRKLTNILKG